MTVRIGLTGGIGSGKSTACDVFRALHVPIIDADVIAREVVKPGTPAYHAIVNHFGPWITLDQTPDAPLDRVTLREKIFHHPAEREWLNQQLHPVIRERMQAALNTVKGPYVILDIPLLAESQGIDFVDRVLVIDCPESVQIQRLMRRDHLNEQQARQILTLQAPRAERLAMADDVIDNSGDKNQLRKAIERLHSQYRAM